MSSATDMDLLRAMAIGVVVQPNAGPATDSSAIVDAINWSFTRSRTIPAPIAEVVTWYETNLRAPDAPQPPTLIDSTLYPGGRTPELAAAENLFLAPKIAVRFARTTNNATKVDVIASGFRRDVHPTEDPIPGNAIVSTKLNWTTDGQSKTRTVDKAQTVKLIDYLNKAPLEPALTYSGTTGGTVFDITFTADDGSTYTAHWDSDIGGGAAGVTLNLGAGRSELVDPDRGFYNLLRDLTKT
ncbi:MAG: hypothetical protein WKF57_04230 [Nakamurella sp.]